MLMEELKPLAVIEFNLHITDTFAREYFSQCFDLWEGAASRYDATNNAYKIAIKRYINPIDAAIQRAALILKTNFTKQIDATNGAEVDETTTANGTTSNTQTNGEVTRATRQYPDGYISAPDSAYIKAEEITAENTIQNDIENTGSATKTAHNVTTDATSENDIMSKAEVLAAYKSSFAVIEKCVFDLVADNIEGEF